VIERVLVKLTAPVVVVTVLIGSAGIPIITTVVGWPLRSDVEVVFVKPLDPVILVVIVDNSTCVVVVGTPIRTKVVGILFVSIVDIVVVKGVKPDVVVNVSNVFVNTGVGTPTSRTLLWIPSALIVETVRVNLMLPVVVVTVLKSCDIPDVSVGTLITTRLVGTPFELVVTAVVVKYIEPNVVVVVLSASVGILIITIDVGSP
jgi:hypothetical protein